jgi:hypothetical protein
MSSRQVRASFNDRTITVYQAYSPQIADAAIAAQTFVAPFKRGRMTWIKPSFLWMMYRSGWACKPGQERVLAIEITRDGFEWALAHAALSKYEPGTHASEQQWAEQRQAGPVRVQWDPDRSVTFAPLSRRAIQIGLSAGAVGRYLDQWITGITNVTPLAERIHQHVSSGDHSAAQAELPEERVYPLPGSIGTRIGASPALPGRSWRGRPRLPSALQLGPRRLAHDLPLRIQQPPQRLLRLVPRRSAQCPDRLDRQRTIFVEVQVIRDPPRGVVQGSDRRGRPQPAKRRDHVLVLVMPFRGGQLHEQVKVVQRETECEAHDQRHLHVQPVLAVDGVA